MTQSRPFHLLLLPGDGIGVEVLSETRRVIDWFAAHRGLAFSFEEDLLGGACYDRHGTFCRDETVAKARAADAVLVGAVGGPRWDVLEIAGSPSDKDGLMRLRQALDLYANPRPLRAYPALADCVTLKPEVVAGVDIIVLRELCGGVLFGEPRGIERLADGSERGFDTGAYSTGEIERIARVGFELARGRRGRVTSVDKSNVMEAGVLWRRVVTRVGARDYPDIALTHLYTDNAAYQMMRDPRAFDVILADNLFGDILSDLGAAIAGSLGLLPSACFSGLGGGRAQPALYEPVHGSAPDIAGRGIANPLGAILSFALMLRYSLGAPAEAKALEAAVGRALEGGTRTRDLGGRASSRDMTDAVLAALDRRATAA